MLAYQRIRAEGPAVRSALGIAQLNKLTANNARRKAWTERYWEALAGCGLELPFRTARGESACHLMPVLLPPGVDRKAFIDALRAERIQTSIHYPPTHRFTYYRSRYGEISLPRTEDIAAREVTLPLYPTMSAELVDLVAQTVVHALK